MRHVALLPAASRLFTHPPSPASPQIHVRLGATPLAGSPALVRVLASTPCAKRCYLAHASAAMTVTVNTHARLTLLTADAWGNPLTRGGATVSSNVIAPGASESIVEDHGDGSYSVSWVTPVTGRCRVSILVGGAHVQGSPFSFRVVAAVSSPPLAGRAHSHLPRA